MDLEVWQRGGGGRERDGDYLQPSLLRDPHLFLAFATMYLDTAIQSGVVREIVQKCFIN